MNNLLQPWTDKPTEFGEHWLIIQGEKDYYLVWVDSSLNEFVALQPRYSQYSPYNGGNTSVHRTVDSIIGKWLKTEHPNKDDVNKIHIELGRTKTEQEKARIKRKIEELDREFKKLDEVSVAAEETPPVV